LHADLFFDDGRDDHERVIREIDLRPFEARELVTTLVPWEMR